MKITVTKSRDVLTPDLKMRAQRAKNPAKAMQAMGLVVVSMAQRAFTQENLRPAKWDDLEKATIKAKKKAGYGSRPLVSSGALAQSPRIVQATGKKVVVGSDRKAGSHSLASIHQLGTKDGRIPARPVWPFNAQGVPTDRAKRSMLAAARKALDLERP